MNQEFCLHDTETYIYIYLFCLFNSLLIHDLIFISTRLQSGKVRGVAGPKLKSRPGLEGHAPPEFFSVDARRCVFRHIWCPKIKLITSNFLDNLFSISMIFLLKIHFLELKRRPGPAVLTGSYCNEGVTNPQSTAYAADI